MAVVCCMYAPLLGGEMVLSKVPDFAPVATRMRWLCGSVGPVSCGTTDVVRAHKRIVRSAHDDVIRPLFSSQHWR